MIEIRWHGRGGQGAKTASLLLANVVFEKGKYVQGFPEYGPERTGAPLTAYNRIADERILIHSNVYNPNYVVVVDESLMGCIPVEDGLKEEGAIVINTTKSVDKIKEKLINKNLKVYTIAADDIALKNIGRAIPNTVMLAAVVKIAGLIEKEEFFEIMETSMEKQFANKREVIAGNMEAIKEAWESVGE